ncbi:peptidase A22B, signal peptide peptidase, partial [Dimargaris cristalligena]
LAVVPIYFGSYSALPRLRSPKKAKSKKSADLSDSSDDESDDDESETVSTEDAYMFPVYGSCVLFGLYLVFKYLNKEYITYLLGAYFSIIGVPALTKLFVGIVRGVTGLRLPRYHLQLTKSANSLLHFKFTNLHLAMAVLAVVITAFYTLTKNWIASNLFGIAFSLSAIQLIRLDSFKTGIIMLMGLFVYDIFWVFGTEVMVSVATKFDGPIKVLWPRNLLTMTPTDPYKMAMLGLGDIVVPGVFVALSLAFDRAQSLKALGYPGVKPVVPATVRAAPYAKPYFTACFTAYFLGLVTTMAVMHFFQAAQPALLYLSPACSASVVILAAVRGELGDLFSFSTEDPEAKDKAADATK